MLDHLIFNKLKWFNVDTSSDNLVVGGKNYAIMPPQIKTKAGIRTTQILGENSYAIDNPTTYNTLGKFIDGYGRTFYVISYDGPCMVNQTDCTPIWGGKHPLSHVWQWIRRAVIL